MTGTDRSPSVRELLARLDGVTLRDEHRLRRRIEGVRRLPDAATREDGCRAAAAAVAAAEVRLAQRLAGVPRLSYPPSLPVSERREDIAEAIRDHQVVVVAGETGSGKTTQLPKICLGLGRGVRGMVGHTQPRRIAARSVAERIAEECGVPLGDAIGYQVRFSGQVGDRTLVKLMTDGILLAELAHDRDLRRYDTLIIDEAHERNLDVDFILGYLTRMLPRRPDLKVVVTSATIDPQRFADHFGGAPVLEVSGRTYPVEVRYRPLLAEADAEADADGAAAAGPDGSGDRAPRPGGPAGRRRPAGRSRAAPRAPEPRDEVTAIGDAVLELIGTGPGDVLVFLSGEREIRDTADSLADRLPVGTEVLVLFGRLSSAEQHRVFSPLGPGVTRRVVLATNVAETSLTVPGIRFVVDPGNARISRYSRRLKVQRLPIEPVSQASADQRAGRCGRLGPGVCIRLYSERDYRERPAFTDPEILRTHLASVVLRMAALGLGEVADFPFVDPPDRRDVADGVRLLLELGAFEPQKPTGSRRGRGGRGARPVADPAAPPGSGPRLTQVGRRLARLPLDPRLGRMVLAAERHGCVHEVLVVAAGLTIQDPRERPTDERAAADALHARFADPQSDFVAFLNLWNYLAAAQEASSSSAFRRLCRAEFLHYLRVREWQDLYGQLRGAVTELGVAVSSLPALPGEAERRDAIHTALLPGLLSQVGLKDGDTRDYLGARGSRFRLVPSSGLAAAPPRWAMVAELVETNRLWGRVAGRTDPRLLEQEAGHLVVRTWTEPHWERGRAAVVAYETVTLYGLPLVTRRAGGYARVDPALCRELLIRHALVEADWDTHGGALHAFMAVNEAAIDRVRDLEDRARRRDLLVDEEVLVDFFAGRVPADVVSGRHFDAWWKAERLEHPDLLTYPASLLVRSDTAGVSLAEFPDQWRVGSAVLPLSYRFEPGADDDGVSVSVPLGLLADPAATAALGLDWQVPGHRLELVTALLRGLPKTLRRDVVPVPDTARAVVAALPREPAGSLTAAVGSLLRRSRGVLVTDADWPSDLPAHLLVRIEAVDDAGRVVDADRDVAALRRRLSARLRRAAAAAAPSVERAGLTAWPGGDLPRTVAANHAGHAVTGYPSLVDEGSTVAVRVLATAAEQERAMALGTRRLLVMAMPAVLPAVVRAMAGPTKLSLAASPYPSVPALLDDCLAAATDALVAAAGGPRWDERGYEALRRAVTAAAEPLVVRVVETVARVLRARREVWSRLERRDGYKPAADDVRRHLAALVGDGFVSRTGWPQLQHLSRYLAAAAARLDAAAANPARDDRLAAVVEALEVDFAAALAAAPALRGTPAATDVRWALEELRVGLFAQSLGTARPVSEQRVRRALAALEP